MTDPIVDEVRAVRAQIAEECGYDLEKIAHHASQTAVRISGLKYVTKEELRERRRQPAESHSDQGK